MILLDLFSGFGGFHLGLQQAGFNFTKTYFSEKDKHCIANYRYNFPEAEYLGAVEDVPDIRADIITFGSPCQDFSLAGKRAGLKGGRSSLIEHAIGLIGRVRPSVFIWENVKGAFSSGGGADFWAIIQAFTNLGGYRLQWQLLNTIQWIPQNRERIFLVGTLGGIGGCEIFPLGESDEGVDERTAEAATVRTLTAGGHSGGPHSGMTLLRWQNKKDGAVRSDFAPSLRSSGGTDIRKRPVILQRPRGNNKGGEHDECPTLSSNSFEHNNHVILTPNNREHKAGDGTATRKRYETNIVPALQAHAGHTQQSYVAKCAGNSIRRLTPVETARLQGLPDDWLKYGNYYGVVKVISDSQQYKMCGNGVSIPPVKAIGEKILKAFM